MADKKGIFSEDVKLPEQLKALDKTRLYMNIIAMHAY